MPTLEERIQTLEDEAAIRRLAAAFADAATRNNMHELTDIWKKDGTLTIGEPMLKVSKGIEAIVAFLQGLRANKEFFVQFVNSGVTTVNGDRATAQWSLKRSQKAKGSSTTPIVWFQTAWRRLEENGFLRSGIFTSHTWISLRSQETRTRFPLPCPASRCHSTAAPRSCARRCHNARVPESFCGKCVV